jgi:hypothetical protein
MSKSKVAQDIVISDTHCGDRLALVPRKGVPLDDGGMYLPSRMQLQLCDMWDEFGRWVKHVTRGEPFNLIHNGDAVDGVHHGSVHQFSHNLGDQVRCAVDVLGPLVALSRESGGTYYHVRGTEAHIGKSGQTEEAVAKALGSRPNEEGQHARWELWRRFPHGGLAHYLHHIGTTGSAAYEATAVHKEMVEAFAEAGRWGDEPPHVVVRSHRHRHIEVRVPTNRGYGTAVVTPAWQLKTPFTWKIPGARLSQPQIGGVLIREGDEELYTRSKVWRLERSKEEA